MDEGAYTGLRAMHDELGEAVAAAYGWLASISHDGDEIVHRLRRAGVGGTGAAVTAGGKQATRAGPGQHGRPIATEHLGGRRLGLAMTAVQGPSDLASG